MRYDTMIYFQKLTQGEYDQETGDYKDDSVSEDQKQASVMDTTTQMMQVVYGMIKQGSLTLQLQNHYDHPFDQIRIGNKIYKVDYSRKLRTKQTFIVSEVQ
nr:MAG TPA: head closure knob [Caudoviricetes sp.]